MILKKECYNDERAIKKGNSLMLKKVIKEAFPTVLAFTMSGMYSIVDGIFVGKAAGRYRACSDQYCVADPGTDHCARNWNRNGRKCFVLSLQRAGRAEGM